ncbi:MAG: hypothetical protein ACPG5B_13355 [Chitinophagales bacterium]
MKNNRYPGVLPFEESQQLLFHGRNDEIEDILHLIKAKDLGVVFAKSGIGKTSLIQAGVMPLLNDEDIYPLEVRFQDKKFTPLEHIYNALEPFVNQKLLQKYVENNKTPTLWQCLKACEFEAKDFLPLFVFDQFEEFFLHQEADRKACSLQLAEMLNDRLPDNIRQQLQQINRAARTAEQLQWFSPLSVKLLFLIRSDKLSLMDEMSRQLPAILSNRYHLKPLLRTAAEDAILIPAELQDEDLWTQAFDYDDDTLDKMLDYLSNEQGEIESFQLQILCQHLETKVAKQQAKGKIDITIFPKDIGNMDNIQNQYYESKIAELPANEQHKARQLIEEELIVENRRIGVDEELLKIRFKVAQQFLEQLLQTRLIRREKNRLGNTYELSHDSLLEPIAQSREKRLAKEAKERAKQERIAQKAKLSEEKRKLRKERKLKEEAEIQRKKAEENWEIAQQNAIETKLQSQMAKRISLIAVAIAILAVFLFYQSQQAANSLAIANKNIQKRIDDYNKQEVERRILVIDGLQQNGELELALDRIKALLKDEEKILNDSLRSVLKKKKVTWE